MLILAVLISQPLIAGDWPHWRGPNRDDVSNESSGFDKGAWPPTKVAWLASVGNGSSSPIVYGNRIYVLGRDGRNEAVFCLDATGGKRLWVQSYPAPEYGRRSRGDKSIYRGPSSTPEYDPETAFLYTLGIDGDLACWNTKNRGQRVWGFNLYGKYKIPVRPNVGRRRSMHRDYGYTTAPLVWKNWVIVEVGDPKRGSLIAFDKKSGKQLWTSEHKDFAGHTGAIVPMTVERIPCAAVLTIRGLLVVRLDGQNAGKTVGYHKWTTDFANNIPTPAVSGNSVVISSAYNQFAMARVDFTLRGAKQVWRQKIATGVCSPITHKGHIYWAWRGVHCVDFANGKSLWRGGKSGTAASCVMTADDRLMIWENRGELVLVETATRSKTKYKELARGKRLFRTDAWPHVVLANGHIICKDRAGNMICYQLGEK